MGTILHVVNATPYAWNLTQKMPGVDLPGNVVANKIYVVPLDRCGAGEAIYSVNDAEYQLMITFKFNGEHDVICTITSKTGVPGVNTYNLGWCDGGGIMFALGYSPALKMFMSIGSVNWLRQLLMMFCNTDITLRHIPFIGSHDAGMGVKGDSQPPQAGIGSKCATLSQTGKVIDQLKAGARFFDLRPVYFKASGYPYQFYNTGHYQRDSGRGYCGQSLDEIFTNIEEFCKTSTDPIILYFSHDMDASTEPPWGFLDEAKWNAIFTLMNNKLGHRLVQYTGDPSDDITKAPFHISFHGLGKVIAVVEPEDEFVYIPDEFKNRIFLNNKKIKNFPLFDDYANTDNVTTMVNDQLEKLKKNRLSPSSEMFLLSWTLTQDTTDVIECTAAEILYPSGYGPASIVNINREAHRALIANVLKEYKRQIDSDGGKLNSYPNIIFLDNVNCGEGVGPDYITPSQIVMLAAATLMLAVNTGAVKLNEQSPPTMDKEGFFNMFPPEA